MLEWVEIIQKKDVKVGLERQNRKSAGKVKGNRKYVKVGWKG